MSVSLLITLILPISLFLIMFGLGLSLSANDFKLVFKHPKAVVIGLFGQMILLPTVAFSLALIFDLSPELAVGLIIIALAPGGATSNMYTYFSKGDVALSISLTVFVSAIAPFTIPIIVALSIDYFIGNASHFQMPVIKTIVQLLVITIVPVALGMFLRKRKTQLANKIEQALKWFSIFFLLLIIVMIIMKNSEKMLGFINQIGLPTLTMNVVVLFLGYQLAKLCNLSQAQATTIGFEVGIQNGTLAMVVAGTLIGNETMMIPAMIYSLLMLITGAAFSCWVRKKAVLITTTKNQLI